jgi:hypothetical protein
MLVPQGIYVTFKPSSAFRPQAFAPERVGIDAYAHIEEAPGPLVDPAYLLSKPVSVNNN